MAKYRAAVVGCGRIASLFSLDPLRKGIVTHAAAYKNNPDTELVAACDINPDRLTEFKKTWGVKALYTDFEEMLRKEAIDILSICTWDFTHYDLVRQAVKHPLKAIFCEKPISDNLSHADAMAKLCRRKGIVLAVNHSRRFDRFEQKIRAYIQAGKLGSIQSVSAYYTAGIMNTGTHLIDLLHFLCGKTSWVWCNPHQRIKAKDPVIDGYLYFRNGFGSTLQGLDYSQYLIFEIDIYGTKGRIRITNSGFSMKYWSVAESPRFSGYKELKETQPLFSQGYKDVLKNGLKDIVSCIRNKKEPYSSGEDALATLEVICGLQESRRQKGRIIRLPLTKRDITVRTK